MALIALVITLIVIGVLLYLMERFLPIDRTIKWIIHVVVIIVTLAWVLSAFGVWKAAKKVKVPQVSQGLHFVAKS